MAMSWEFPLSKLIYIKICLFDKVRIFKNWTVVDIMLVLGVQHNNSLFE